MFTDLIFDLYGTLVDIRTEEDDLVWEKTAFFFGFYGAAYTPGELKQAFQRAMSERKAQAGQSYECFPDIPFEQVMAQLFRKKGVEAEPQGLGLQAAQLFRISSLRYIRLYPAVREALKALKEKGCRLWLLSNAQRAFTAYELRLLELEPYFDGIWISSDYGCRKPDVRFFQAPVEEKGLQIGQCLMIGNDRETDIAGARAMGMATLYMHSNITPPEQAPADPVLLPSAAAPGTRHWEFEGQDWKKLEKELSHLIR